MTQEVTPPSEPTVPVLYTPSTATPPNVPAATPTPSTPRPGAPRGNTNGLKHGLVGCGWPAGTERDRRHVLRLKRAVADAVLEQGRDIDVTVSALIETVGDWERHRRLASRWLRVASGLSVDQRLALSRDVARAGAERDKALSALKLNTSPQALWATLTASEVSKP